MSTFDYIVTIADSTTTVTLTNNNPHYIAEYHPRTAPRDDEFINETLVIRTRDGSVPNNLDELRTIQGLFRQAEDAQENRDKERVYITFKTSTGASEYRSEIVNGRAEWLDDTLTVPRWDKNSQRAALSITRRNWWEGPESVLSLTNGNATNSTTGITVYNHDDGDAGDDNYVAIDAAEITGDLPGNTRLELTNLYSTGSLRWMWVGHNYTDPSNFAHILEGENADGASGTANTTCSNGAFERYSLPNNSESAMFTWTISAADITAAAGRYYKAVARWSTTGAAGAARSTWFRIRITSTAGTIYWQSGRTKPDSDYNFLINDLLTFRYPPWLMGMSDQASLKIVLTGYQTTGSPINIDLDFLALLPVDGFRFFDTYGMAQNERLVDDGIDNRLLVDDGSDTARRGIVVGYGRPIRMEPSKDQRLYFFQHQTTGDTAQIDRKLSVKAYYRPKRLSL